MGWNLLFLHPGCTLHERISSVDLWVTAGWPQKAWSWGLLCDTKFDILWICFMEEGHNLQQQLQCVCVHTRNQAMLDFEWAELEGRRGHRRRWRAPTRRRNICQSWATFGWLMQWWRDPPAPPNPPKCWFDCSSQVCGQSERHWNPALWRSVKLWPSEISAFGSRKLWSDRRGSVTQTAALLFRRPTSPLPRWWWIPPPASPKCGAALREAGWPWSIALPASVIMLIFKPPPPNFPPHSQIFWVETQLTSCPTHPVHNSSSIKSLPLHLSAAQGQSRTTDSQSLKFKLSFFSA